MLQKFIIGPQFTLQASATVVKERPSLKARFPYFHEIKVVQVIELF